MGHEALYPRTAPGRIEVKHIPPARAYESRSDSDFFDARVELFRRDFRFLRLNSLPMTVPVEAEIDPGAMRLFVPADKEPRVEVRGVTLLTTPERTVASFGLRGGYTRARYDEGVERLHEWLTANPSWRAVGGPYAVYWHGPTMPRFLKRSEVHQRIELAP